MKAKFNRIVGIFSTIDDVACLTLYCDEKSVAKINVGELLGERVNIPNDGSLIAFRPAS